MNKLRNNVVIEKAREQDLNGLVQLYDELIDALEKDFNYPCWKKGVYPSLETGRGAIESGSLYILRYHGIIKGSIVLNHHQEAGYENGNWQQKGGMEDVYCVHTFCVHPDCHGQGFGKMLLEFAKNQGRQDEKKALWLDVLEQNTKAIALYESCGFQMVGKTKLAIGLPGNPDFRLYEYVL